MEYPKWIYHATEEAKVIDSADEYEQHLAEGWADTPAAFKPQADNDPASNDDPPKMTQEEREKKIEEAIIEIMVNGGEEKLTAIGAPKVEAIEELLKFDVTADERTEIFERLNAKGPTE